MSKTKNKNGATASLHEVIVEDKSVDENMDQTQSSGSFQDDGSRYGNSRNDSELKLTEQVIRQRESAFNMTLLFIISLFITFGWFLYYFITNLDKDGIFATCKHLIVVPMGLLTVLAVTMWTMIRAVYKNEKNSEENSLLSELRILIKLMTDKIL